MNRLLFQSLFISFISGKERKKEKKAYLFNNFIDSMAECGVELGGFLTVSS